MRGFIEESSVKDIADAIREKTESTREYLPSEMGEAIRSIGAVILPAIPNEVKGTSLVTCHYVNENEHNVEVKLSSDTVTDFSGVEVKVQANNFFDISKFNSTNDFVNNGDGTITCKNHYPNVGVNKISVCCPNIKVGQKIFISGNNITNVYFGNIVKTVNIKNSSFTVTQEMLDVDNFAFYGKSSATTDNPLILSDIMINEGTEALPYEPYFAETYTSNADGTVDGVTSISPVMNIICEGVDISAKYYQIPSADYDRFWDSFQKNGQTPISYYYAFSGVGWTSDNLKPKYDIVPNDVRYMFSFTKLTDLDEILEKANVTIDLSNVTNLDCMFFYSSKLTKIPPLDLSSVITINQAFRYCNSLKEIELRNVQPTCTFTSPFYNCSSLEDFRCNGTFGNSISFGYSKILSNESIQNIIDCLADLTGQTAQKITFHSSVVLKLTDEQKLTILLKNWELT